MKISEKILENISTLSKIKIDDELKPKLIKDLESIIKKLKNNIEQFKENLKTAWEKFKKNIAIR